MAWGGRARVGALGEGEGGLGWWDPAGGERSCAEVGEDGADADGRFGETEVVVGMRVWPHRIGIRR